MGQIFDKIIGCVSRSRDFCFKEGREMLGENDKSDSPENSIDINEKYLSDNKFVNINQYIVKRRTSDFGSMERLDKLLKEDEKVI